MDDAFLTADGSEPPPAAPRVRYHGAVESRYDFETAAICRDCSEFAEPALCTFEYAPSWHSGGGLPSSPLPFFAVVVRTAFGDLRTYYTDERGQLLREVSFLEPPTGHASVPSRSVWYAYDEQGQLRGVENDNGDRTCLERDERGNVVRETVMFDHRALDSPDEDGVHTQRGVQRRYDYTDEGQRSRLHRTYLPRRSKGQEWQVDTELTYSGPYIRITTAEGLTTSIMNELFERPREITYSSGLVERRTYDLATGTLDTVTLDATGPEPLTTDYDADTAGRLVRVTGPTGLEMTIEYVSSEGGGGGSVTGAGFGRVAKRPRGRDPRR